MKYKVGDKVRVKSLDWYNTNKNKVGAVPLKSQYFVKNMSKFCDTFVTIKRVTQSYYLIEEDDFGWHFTDKMFDEGIYLSELYCDKTQKIIWTESAPDTTELVIGENHELIINDGVYKVIKKKPHKEETMEKDTNKSIFEGNTQFCDIMNDIIKEETMEEKGDKAKAPNLVGEDYFGKRFGYKIPDGYEFETIYNNEIILKPKKPKYPTTYKGCCEVLCIGTMDNDTL